MTEPIYRDDIFIVKENGDFFISSIPKYPPSLRKIELSNGEIYHSSMDEFNSYRDKFKAILKYLETETDEAFYITCLRYKVIEASCFELDIRFKDTPQELGNILLLAYRIRKEDAVKRIQSLIAKNNDLNYKEEEERDRLINQYNLVDVYKEFMTSGWNRLLDGMSEALKELKEQLDKNN